MDIKRIALAGGVLATAGAIGFVMQNGESAKARYARDQVPDISGTASDPLEVTDIKLTSAVADVMVPSIKPKQDAVQTTTDAAGKMPVETASTNAAKDVLASSETSLKTDVAQEFKTAALNTSATPKTSAPSLPKSAPLCEINMSATASAGAMVDVSLDAGCYPNERVTFHHNGMMFTQSTDKSGQLDLSIPALAENAVIIVAFANGEGSLASAKVPTLASFDRMVVQSKAKSNLHINAFEFGAGFNEDGHVTAGSARTVDDAVHGSGGFMTVLGDSALGEALVAEVYTFPSSTSLQDGDVHVSVDANVTLANCGLRIEAQTLEVSRAGPMKVQDLTLPIPGCGAVGDFLVLQNLLQDLKVARN